MLIERGYMKTIDEWLDEYGESHQNKTNKKIHWICVPVIMFTVFGLLWSIPHGYFASMALFPEPVNSFFNWATIFLLVVTLFYLRMSKVMFVGMFLIGTAMLLGTYFLAKANLAPLWAISIAIFVVAWIGQFIGHKIEGKKPSFFKDVQFLLIGPAWLLSFIYKKVGIRYS